MAKKCRVVPSVISLDGQKIKKYIYIHCVYVYAVHIFFFLTISELITLKDYYVEKIEQVFFVPWFIKLSEILIQWHISDFSLLEDVCR